MKKDLIIKANIKECKDFKLHYKIFNALIFFFLFIIIIIIIIKNFHNCFFYKNNI